MNPAESTAVPGSMEIVSTRIFDVPRERVFEAFANPHHLPHWWGPAGFTNTIQEFDLRPGGAWRLVMHGPDGKDYENESVFLEVKRREKISYDHVRPMHRFQMTMTYEDVDGGTRLTWRMVFAPDRGNEQLRGFIVAANEQNFDRLAAYLKQMP
jgi:uncharacterized protein YndB with AHSA1/START domain